MPDSVENLALLPLLLLVFLPIILHLLDRRRAQTVTWPAVRFLLAADKRLLRRLRLLETLLIAARTLVLLFLILAVLHPFRTESVLRRDTPDRRRGAVFIIDTSFSMAYRISSDEPSSLEHARNMALRLLEEFRPGDQVTVIDHREPVSPPEDHASALPSPGTTADRNRDQGGDSSSSSTPRSSAVDDDLEVVRAQVRAVKLRSGTLRLTRVLDRAVSILDTLPTETSEIFILTDLTASSFAPEDKPQLPFLRSRLEGLPAPPTLRLLDCGALAPRNRSISSVRSGPLAIGTDGEARLEIRLGVWAEEDAAAGPSPHPASSTIVRLLSGLEELAAKEVTFEAGQAPTARFSQPFDRGGLHSLTARISPDGLREDDAHYHVLEVYEQLEVLVAGTPPADEGTARFVRLALAPRAADSPNVDVVFQADFATELESEDLAGYRVLIICDLPRQSENTIRKIEEFVRAGGGLIIFCGEQTHSASWNQHGFRGSHGLLPARLSTRSTSGRFGAMRPRDIRTAHSALTVFAPPDQGDLERINIHRLTTMVDLSSDAAVLAGVEVENDTLPWIIEKPCGRGKVILFATSATLEGSDLPRSSLFLPLVHQFTRYLASTDPAARNLRCGQPIRVDFERSESTGGFFVIDPHGEEHSLMATVESGMPVGIFRGTDTPGFYEVHTRVAEKSSAQPERYAVNFPARESDLRRLSEATLRQIQDSLDLQMSRNVEDLQGRLVAVTTKRQFWPYMVALAIVFIFMELLLTFRLAQGRLRE